MTLLTDAPETSEDDRASKILAAIGGNEDISDDDVGDDAGQPDREPAEGSDEAPDAAEAEEKPSTYTVKVDGKEMEVTLDDLLSGYSREEDYRRKTASVAEERRAIQQEREAFQKAQAEFAQKQAAAMQQLAGLDPVLAEARTIDWQKLAQEDPAGYVAKQAQVQARVAEIQRAQQEQRAAQIEQFKATRAREQELLVKAIPDFGDAEKGDALKAELSQLLTEGYGFTPEEIGSVVDHRMIVLANDARLWRAAEKARKEAEAKKAAPQPGKTIRPGANGTGRDAQAQALRKRALRSKSMDDAADYILSQI